MTTHVGTDYTFAAADFNFRDPDGDALSSVKIVTLFRASGGTLKLDGSAIASADLPKTVSKADIDAGKLTYTPPNAVLGAFFVFKVNDGADDSASSYNMITYVTANAAPTASDRTVTTHEDTDYTFAAANFNFADADSRDALSSVKIVTLPAAGKGTLKLDGSAIAAANLPKTVTKADIDAGKLIYTPPPNANGSGYASFTFKVNDGTDDSASAYTLTLDVTAVAVNAAPTASDRTVTTQEDTDYTFAAANFNFTDTDSGAALSSVKIVTLPTAGKGTLKLDGSAIAAADLPQTVTKADIDAGKLTYTPPANANGSGYASFTFKVNDGTDDSASAYTLTLDVTALNDPATGTPTITGTATVGRTLTAATSAIMDADGLTSATYAYQWIRVATDSTETDISGATSSTYTLVADDEAKTIKVKVSFSDDAGNAETLTSAATAAVAANAAPTASNGTVTTHEDTVYTFAAANFNFADTDDSASAYTLTLDVTAVNDPATGTPTITGTAQVGQTLTAATSAIMDADGLTGATYAYQWIRVATDSTETDISGATSSTYTLVADDEAKTIKVKVSFSDDAGNPETLTSAATAAVAANAAPTASDRTVTTHEDMDYTFAAANFNFADTDSGAALSSVKIVTRPAPGKGTLELDGSAIAAADLPKTVTRADIDAGKLTYTPPANANGSGYASFTFKVNDGSDDSASAYTLTLDVTALNDPATGTPTITGTAQVGQTLTAVTSAIMDADGLSGATYAYQWIRVATDSTETDISGATSSAYTLVRADQGATIKVKVSFSDDANNAETLTSVATAAVVAAPNTAATGVPGITGTAQVGQTLTAVTSAIMDADGLSNVSYTYQWIRVDGGSETDISSATASGYTLVRADQGRDDQGKGELQRRRQQRRDADQRGDGGRGGGAEHRRDGRAGDHRHGAGRADADGGHQRHHGRRRAEQCQLRLPVDPGGHRQHRDGYLRGDGERLHAGEGGPGRDDQGQGELQRRRQQRRDADQRGDGGRGGGAEHRRDGRAGDHRHGAGRADADGGHQRHHGRRRAEQCQLRLPVDPGGHRQHRDGTSPSATASGYTLVRADQGATIKVKVSFSDDANNAETLTSVATAAVAAAPNTAATGVPTITGTARVGQTLTAVTSAIMDADGLSNVSYTYQWIRVATDSTETDISGATSSAYTLVADDEGKTIKVKVSFSDDANNAETLTSVATAAVAAASNTAATGVPGITGTAQVGQTLTAVTSAIMDADGLTGPTYAYQWIRVATDSTETDISRGDVEHLHPGGGRPEQDHQGKGELQRRRQQRRDADQRGDGGRGGGVEHRRDGRAGDHRHGAGRADADGGHQRHHGRRRADRRHLRLPVDPGGHRQHRDGHFRGDVEYLHPGGGRPGQDHQGQGELQRRRRQPRDAHQRGDGGGGGRGCCQRSPHRVGPHGDHGRGHGLHVRRGRTSISPTPTAPPPTR